MTAPTFRLIQGGNQPRPSVEYLREARAEYASLPPTDPRCDLAYRRALLAAARVDAEALAEFAAKEKAYSRPAFRPVTLRESIDARLDACASVYSEALQSRGRYRWRHGRAPANEELLAAARGLLTLGLFVLTLLLIMQGI